MSELLIRRARLQASSDFPYFQSALWAFTFVPKPGLREIAGGPIGVDKYWRVYYDPEELEKYKKDAVALMLIHEVGHVVRKHEERCLHRHRKAWNIAGDAEINDDLPKLAKYVPDCVMPRTLGLPKGKTAEWYYERLEVKEVKMSCGSGAGNPLPFEEGEPSGGSPGLTEEEADLIRVQVAQDIIEKARGSVPGGWARWAEETLKPQAPWKQVLNRYVRKALRVKAGFLDYSYCRPPRREFGDVILPRMVSPEINASIVADTSGSMGESELAHVIAESKAICSACGATPTIRFVDAAVQSKAKVDKGMASKMKGGGGTDMGVGIAAALEDKPDVIIVLTDGYTPWPEDPGVPVVIGVIGNGEVPDHWPLPEWAVSVAIRCE